MKDFGVYFDRGLSFRQRINKIVLSASKALAFIMRNTKSFRNT